MRGEVIACGRRPTGELEFAFVIASLWRRIGKDAQRTVGFGLAGAGATFGADYSCGAAIRGSEL